MSFNFDIYTGHFGLTKKPFTLVPDPDFVFWSRAHLKAKAILEYGLVNRSPITMVTGEIGSGKTTLLRHMLSKSSDELTIGLIANAAASDRADLMRLVLHALGQPVGETVVSYAALYHQLEALLVEEYGQGRRVVLIFDEAQNLDRDALEHLRMLTNINFADHELVQMVLFGQPELRDMVMRPDMRQLAQRISANVFLPSLSEADVRAYIEHRLGVAGAKRRLFDLDTMPLIFEITGGTPRLVNQLCDFALLYAFVDETPTVTPATIRRILEDELFLCADRGQPLRLVRPAGLAATRGTDDIN
ncbi:ExeA family protein [Salipiger mangrovisoli]|uniref:AAA family ATPase n=1 Tax=Salipiger mangrovisoli TaxID=2865933 RepID=A0ABR9XAC9_9RHOB|nr:AAA family ATPase [Salipiger mangrovisoli]MBE9640441.1 AAA family ATPase [Salipiger mangrovisoli]